MLTITHEWCEPPDILTLCDDEIHIWRSSLDLRQHVVDRLLSFLTQDEHERAKRFVRPKDRDHFIVARGVLRHILSRYLPIGPGELRFCYNSYGKPALSYETGASHIMFSVAHSHGLGLYAVTSGKAVGVDIEYIRSNINYEQIAASTFSAAENNALQLLPIELRLRAFFTCWTRKEAYIKALGEGLSHPLDQFTVSLRPDEPAMLLQLDQNPQENSSWSIRELQPGAGFVGAIVVAGRKGYLRCWQWATCGLDSIV